MTNDQRPKNLLKYYRSEMRFNNLKRFKLDYNLENRLIEFTGIIASLIDSLNPKISSEILAKQIFRSASSSALNYAEAMGSESRKDFIHKMSISLKELRETEMNLKLIQRCNSVENVNQLKFLLDETSSLIKIFFTSIRTAKSKL
jgi:four helix bundle protein